MKTYAPNTKKGSRRAGEGKRRVGKSQKSAARQAARKQIRRGGSL